MKHRIFQRHHLAAQYATLLKGMDETPRNSVLAPHIPDSAYDPVVRDFLAREGFDPHIGFAVYQGGAGEIHVYQG